MADRRMPIEEFLPLYLKAVKDGVTKEAFAQSIGVKVATVYQRVYELRKNGADLPLLRAERRRSLSDRVKAIMDGYDGPKSKPGKKAEKPVEADIELPNPLADILN